MLDQVEREYDGFGRLVAEYQAHDGTVDTSGSGTPRVDYEHTSGIGNVNRPTKIIYPNGRILEYTYSGATNDALSRVQAIEDGAIGGGVLVSYVYLGAGSIMRTNLEQPELRLDLWGGSVGSYAGLDRFGRVIDHRWEGYAGSSDDDVVRITHGYDRNSNRLYRRDETARDHNAQLDELYSHDPLDRDARRTSRASPGPPHPITREYFRRALRSGSFRPVAKTDGAFYLRFGRVWRGIGSVANSRLSKRWCRPPHAPDSLVRKARVPGAARNRGWLGAG